MWILSHRNCDSDCAGCAGRNWNSVQFQSKLHVWSELGISIPRYKTCTNHILLFSFRNMCCSECLLLFCLYILNMFTLLTKLLVITVYQIKTLLQFFRKFSILKLVSRVWWNSKEKIICWTFDCFIIRRTPSLLRQCLSSLNKNYN